MKLSDFGFAKVDDGNLMTPHFTPYYVAPQVKLNIITSEKVASFPVRTSVWDNRKGIKKRIVMEIL